MGNEWDGTLMRFTQNKKYERFEDILEYKETSSSYTTYEVTLHAVEGGTAATEYVDPDNFPSVGD